MLKALMLSNSENKFVKYIWGKDEQDILCRRRDLIKRSNSRS